MNGLVTPLSGRSIKKRIFKIYSKWYFMEERGEEDFNFSKIFFTLLPS